MRPSEGAKPSAWEEELPAHRAAAAAAPLQCVWG